MKKTEYMLQWRTRIQGNWRCLGVGPSLRLMKELAKHHVPNFYELRIVKLSNETVWKHKGPTK